jgi:hypothetical protein
VIGVKGGVKAALTATQHRHLQPPLQSQIDSKFTLALSICRTLHARRRMADLLRFPRCFAMF